LTTGNHNGVTKRYDAFVGHRGMDASANNSGEVRDRGAAHSRNRLLKSAINHELIQRGSREFRTIEDYQRFFNMLVARPNRQPVAAI